MDTSSQVNEELMHSGLAFQLRFNGTSSSHLLHLPQVGDQVTLIPEPDHQFDPAAVAICDDQGLLGYINPQQNSGLSTYLQQGKPYFAQLKVVGELTDTHNLKYGILVYAISLIPDCKEVIRVPTRG